MLTMESDMKGGILHATMPPHHASAALHGHAASPYSALGPLMNLGQSHLTQSHLSQHHHHHMATHLASSGGQQQSALLGNGGGGGLGSNPLSSLQTSMANTLNGSASLQQQQQQQQRFLALANSQAPQQQDQQQQMSASNNAYGKPPCKEYNSQPENNDMLKILEPIIVMKTK
uniref:Uncharacterized protein n=1 Tax=Bactrocera dorsalis TaxID=27457 RepID=A0A034W456_BACDO